MSPVERSVRLYIHPNNNDVAFEILKKYYIKEGKRYSLKVRWWRVSRERKKIIQCMNIIERLKLPASKLREYEVFNGSD